MLNSKTVLNTFLKPISILKKAIKTEAVRYAVYLCLCAVISIFTITAVTPAFASGSILRLTDKGGGLYDIELAQNTANINMLQIAIDGNVIEDFTVNIPNANWSLVGGGKSITPTRTTFAIGNGHPGGLQYPAGVIATIKCSDVPVLVYTGDSHTTMEVAGDAGIQIRVLGVTFASDDVRLHTGATAQLTPVFINSDATDQAVSYVSSNPFVLSVSDTGLVTGLNNGVSVVTVTTHDGNHTAACNVTVSTPVSGITVTPSSATMYPAGTLVLSATITPIDATNKDVVWTSNMPGVVSVDQTGLVNAIALGNAVITAETVDGGYIASCDISVVVEPVPVSGVRLSSNTATVNRNNVLTLVATVVPANATNNNVSWTSSSPSVATVSVDAADNRCARITAVSQGVSTITVTTADGNFTDTCVVTVPPDTVPVTGITLNKTGTSLNVGTTDSTLVYTITPSNATDKTVAWSINKSDIATVSQEGVITGVAAGTAVVTVSTNDGGKAAVCTVTVNPNTIPVTGVTVSPSTLSMVVGDVAVVSAAVQPLDATNQNITWSVEDNKIASIDQHGNVTGLVTGKTVAKATTSDGGHTSSCSITVSSKTDPDPDPPTPTPIVDDGGAGCNTGAGAMLVFALLGLPIINDIRKYLRR